MVTKRVSSSKHVSKNHYSYQATKGSESGTRAFQHKHLRSEASTDPPNRKMVERGNKNLDRHWSMQTMAR